LILGRKSGGIPKADAALYSKEGIMKDANSRPDLISRCLKRSRTSFQRLFNSIPDLASDADKSIHHNTKSAAREVAKPEQRYQDLLAKLQRDHTGVPRARERPRNVRQLQEAVNNIVRERKQKMAKAHSKEEILLAFVGGIYKIKSLL
jgi:hypothetical protein